MGGLRSTHTSQGSALPSTEEGRAFLQERIALYCRTMALVVGALYLFTLVAWKLFPELRAQHHVLALSSGVAAGLIIAVVWVVVARREDLPAERLRLIDATVLLTAATALAVGAYAARDSAPNVFTSVLFVAFLVLARVPLVPSSGLRTLTLGVIAWIPMAVTAVLMVIEYQRPMGMHPIAFLAGTSLFVAISVAIATSGSHVIYGLRRQVQKAMLLGQYRLHEKLGEGGMGVVYRGSHSMLRRPAAIKLLHPERTGEQSLQRFEREVQMTAQLAHPNTVAIYDYGRSSSGVFYYAMEYLDGTDLQSLVDDRGAQPPGRVVHILSQCCGALREAHDLGLIHRDIKPANIILCQRGGLADVAKVVDFGLAKELDAEEISSGVRGISSSNAVAGTPAYLAPETILSPADVTGQVDIYALGAVGYFLLTGLSVFEGASVVEICGHHALTEPTPPSERTDKIVPKDLEDLLLRCLAKQPEDRPQGAAALASELAALADAGTWTEELAAEWWDRWHRQRADSPSARPPHATTLVSPLELQTDVLDRSYSA